MVSAVRGGSDERDGQGGRGGPGPTDANASAAARRDRRGQLVLAGSVALAVAVVGVAVLLNAAMFTDAVTAADRPREATASAETYRQVVEADLARLVDEAGDDGPPDAEALRRNVSTYRDRMALSAARSASASLDVRLVDASPPTYTFVFTFDTPELRYRTELTVRWRPP